MFDWPGDKYVNRDRKKGLLRCDVTGNPSGTDTCPEGQHCICHDCRLQAREIRLQALVTEREGMVAENQLRLGNGHSPAYGDDHFDEIAAKMLALLEE